MNRAIIALSIAATVAGCGPRAGVACSRVPDISTFSMASEEVGESAARARAERCLHYEAYRLAPGGGGNEALALGAMGACLVQIQVAQGAAYMSGTTPTPPPPGFTMTIQKGSAVPGDASEAERVSQTRETLSRRVLEDMRLIALFRVAEARALRCK